MKLDGAIILAGGSGTRLWPLSRELRPKHLIKFNDDNMTLFQKTLKRICETVENKNVYVVTNKKQYFEILDQGRELGIDLKEKIIVEKYSKGTIFPVVLAMKQWKQMDEDFVFGVFPSDHYIGGNSDWIADMEKAKEIAGKDKIVTIGIIPDRVETGYGYIEKGSQEEGCYKVKRFTEKPDYDKAKVYVESKSFLWNSGAFIINKRTILGCLDKYQKEYLDYYNAEISAENLPEISLDVGIMEKTPEIINVIPAKFEWDDLGDWEAVYRRMGKKDEHGNVIWGDVMADNCTNSLLISNAGKLVAVDIDNSIVIKTEDTILTCPRDSAQKVKNAVHKLKLEKSHLIESHPKVFKPWGSYETIERGKRYLVKILKIKPGHSISLQKHFHRSEHWLVTKGTALVQVNEKEHTLIEGHSIDIPKTSMHRLTNPGKIDVEVVEIQLGGYLQEDDIERYEDQYGRV